MSRKLKPVPDIRVDAVGLSIGSAPADGQASKQRSFALEAARFFPEDGLAQALVLARRIDDFLVAAGERQQAARAAVSLALASANDGDGLLNDAQRILDFLLTGEVDRPAAGGL